MKPIALFSILVAAVAAQGDGLWPCVDASTDCSGRSTITECNFFSCVCEDGWDPATNCMTPTCDDCGAGDCIGPNECACPAGTAGPDCSITCACTGDSECNDGASGDGTCNCPPGLYGPTCADACPTGCGGVCDGFGECGGQCEAGFYGTSCSTACSCDQTCDESGACECFLGRWDDANGCDKLCGAGCADSTCDSDNGQCTCIAGFTGSNLCQYNCPNTVPGVNGADEIPCSGNGVCDIGTATCECDPGYWGPGCASTCPGGAGELACGGERRGVCNDGADGDGTCLCVFGFNPASDCQDCTENSACGGNGVCNNGDCVCEDGFWGPSCAQECPGVADAGVACYDRGVCNAATGVCDCVAGAFGDACESFDCNPACEDGADCIPGQQCLCADGSTVSAGEPCTGGDGGASNPAGIVLGIAIPLLLLGVVGFMFVSRSNREAAGTKAAPEAAPEAPRAPKKKKVAEEKKPLVASPPAEVASPPAEAPAAPAAPAAAAAPAAPKRRSSSAKRKGSSGSKGKKNGGAPPAVADAPVPPPAAADPVVAEVAAADPELSSAVDENAALRAELERLRAEAAALDE